MTPYYCDDLVTLYHGDARLMVDEQAAVVITDPPYGFRSYATDRAPAASLLKSFTEQRTTAAIFGYPETLVQWCVAMGLVPDEWVTWWPADSKMMRAVGPRLRRESEAVAIFGATYGERITRPRAASQFGRNVATTRGLDPETCRDGDVWRVSDGAVGLNGHLRQHPNQKPAALMRRLVLLCSNPNDTILDPFAGSGTTLRAAKDLGRRSVGVEIEERFCEIAARRLAQEVLDFGEAS